MKKYLIAVMTVFLLASSFTMECDEYYAFHKGATFEYTIYNAKNKVDMVNTYHVNEVSKSDAATKAAISFVGVNEKGKDKLKGNFDLICENGNYYVDAKNFIAEEQTEAYKDFTLKITNKQNAEHPNNLAVGQKLKDAAINIDILSKDGALFGSIECNITNRSVLKNDTVNVPAGSYTAFQISSDISSKVKIMGMGVPLNVKSLEYFVPKFGMVKTISYNKSGDKVRSTQVLSKYSK